MLGGSRARTRAEIGIVSCGDNYFAWGIAFAPSSNDVYVGTDCGLAVSTNKGVSWTLLSLPKERVEAVVAQAGGIVDLCTQAGHRRYVKAAGGLLNPVGGLNLIPGLGAGCTHTGAAWVHALAAPPQETGVLFAFTPALSPNHCNGSPEKLARIQIFLEGHIKADNTWEWHNINGGCATRPPVVSTVLSRDGNPNHFDIYYAGGGRNAYRGTCTSGVPGVRCPNLPAIDAPTYPNGPKLAHGDVSGISFHPTHKCPNFMVSDGGVMKPVPQSGASCADSFVMAAGSGAINGGFNALQIYEVDGQVHPPSGHTDLYFGTQDNGVWASPDGGATWPRKVGAEGFGLEMPHEENDSDIHFDPDQRVIFTTCGNCMIRKFTPHFAHDRGEWKSPPGELLHPAGPYLLQGTKEFVQWTKIKDVFQLHRTRTTNFGSSWNAIDGATPQTAEPRGRGLVVGPAPVKWMYQPLVGGGLARITGLNFAQATVTDIGAGLGRLGQYSAAEGSFACCESAFAAALSNPLHLVAADEVSKQMKQSHDGGATWQPDTELTNLVTGDGRFDFFVPWHGTQARAIASTRPTATTFWSAPNRLALSSPLTAATPGEGY